MSPAKPVEKSAELAENSAKSETRSSKKQNGSQQTSSKNVKNVGKTEPAFVTRMVNKYTSGQAPTKPAKLFARNQKILAKQTLSFAGLAKSFVNNHEILA